TIRGSCAGTHPSRRSRPFQAVAAVVRSVASPPSQGEERDVRTRGCRADRALAARRRTGVCALPALRSIRTRTTQRRRTAYADDVRGAVARRTTGRSSARRGRAGAVARPDGRDTGARLGAAQSRRRAPDARRLPRRAAAADRLLQHDVWLLYADGAAPRRAELGRSARPTRLVG